MICSSLPCGTAQAIGATARELGSTSVLHEHFLNALNFILRWSLRLVARLVARLYHIAALYGFEQIKALIWINRAVWKKKTISHSIVIQIAISPDATWRRVALGRVRGTWLRIDGRDTVAQRL